jgi:PAS domain S-box-containing protein
MRNITSGIAFKLTGFMLLVSVVPILVLQLISYGTTQRTVLEVAVRHQLQVLGNQRDYLNLQTDQLEALAENPAWAGELAKLQAVTSGSKVLSGFDRLAVKTRIGQLLSGYSGLSSLHSIDLYGLEGGRFHFGESDDALDDNPEEARRMVAKTLLTPDRTVWHGGVGGKHPAPEGGKLIVATKAISRHDSTGSKMRPVGVLRMNLSANYLHHHFSNLDLGAKAYLLLVDAQQKLLFHPEPARIGQDVNAEVIRLLQGDRGSLAIRLAGSDAQLSYLRIPDKQWCIVSVVPHSTLAASMVGIKRVGGILLLASVLLIVVFLNLYRRQVVEPIRAVINGFRDFQTGRITPDWRLKRGKNWIQIDELVTLFNTFLDSMQARRQAETDLRIAATAFEAQEGIVVTDAESVVLRVNLAFTKITGYPAEEIVGRKINLLKSGRHDKAFFDAMWERILHDGSWRGEIWNRIKNGEIHPHWLNISTVRGGDGAITHFVGTLLDISDRMQAEEHLRESQLRFQAVIEQSNDGVTVADLDGRYLMVNPAFCAMTGYSQDELLNMRVTDVLPNGSEPHLFRQATQDERAGRRESVLLCKDDRRIMASVSGSLLQIGAAQFVLGIVQDITDLKHAEEEREKLQAQLLQAQKMESLGSLAGGVAHDMNNVLGAILGLASSSLRTEPPTAPSRQAFETIIKAAERGGKMVHSLLSFARQKTAELRQLDVNELLQEEVRLLERTTLAKVRIELDRAVDLKPILGDGNALTHAIMNLCVNAVDAMPENGTLTLRTRNLGPGWVEVVVEDTGIGMPKEILDRALDPFFTTKELGKGTGLGLAMVYSTVKAHHGELEIQSEPGRGTSVRLRFPACEPTAQAAESVPEAPTGCGSGALGILLVDDDPLIRESTRMLLEALGHRVTTASSGEEALELLEGDLQPELVILDMNMPGLGGRGTLPRIRSRWPALPVLLATGRVDQVALDLVKADGNSTLLSKPYSLDDMEAKIAATMRRR